MQVDDVVGAAFLPTDGQASPSDIAMSLAKGARQGGVTIKEGVRVTAIETDGGVARAVVTDQGRIECEKVVICAGQWSREIGKLAGVNIPLVSVQHQYLITEKIEGVTSNLPTLRDPDRLTYWKEEVGGLVMGGYEPNPLPWAEKGLPENFEFQLLENDLDHFEPLLELATGRVPAMQTAGIKSFINGPESFTPDGNFILGEAPEVRGVFVGAGFNAFGIASGGGAGMALAEWVAKGEPPYDLWPVDIRRFGRNHLRHQLGAHAHDGGLRQALHHGVAVRGAFVRTPAAAFAALRSPQGARRSVRREARLGAAQLVRRRRGGRDAGGPLQLRAPELVRGRRARAQGLPRAGGGVRSDVVREVLDDGARCRSGAVVDRVQQCREARRLAHLYADAEPARRHRMRSDRRAGGVGRILHRHRHRLSRRTTSTGSRARSRRASMPASST